MHPKQIAVATTRGICEIVSSVSSDDLIVNKFSSQSTEGSSNAHKASNAINAYSTFVDEEKHDIVNWLEAHPTFPNCTACFYSFC